MKQLKYAVLIFLVSFGSAHSRACNPATGVVEYNLSSADKRNAFLELGRYVVIGKKSSSITDGVLCPDGFSLRFDLKPETSDINKRYNEAVRGCTKIFQLYLLSTQRMKFIINSWAAGGIPPSEGDSPHCTLLSDE